MSRPIKRILIVENEPWVRNITRNKFIRYNSSTNAVFAFKVDDADTVEAAIARIRQREDGAQYDVIVLDLELGAEAGDFLGVRLASAVALCARLGQIIPVTIVFSGHATILALVVEVMRSGVWDFVDKKSTDFGVDAFQRVVDSAVSRLRALDVQKVLKIAAVRWTHRNIAKLQAQYGGQVVAIGLDNGSPQHAKVLPPFVDGGDTLETEQRMGVVAHGRDAFELEMRLYESREEIYRRSQQHPSAESLYSYIVSIPAQPVKL